MFATLNSRGTAETQEAASEGANGIMDAIKSGIAGGKLEDVKQLFSGGSMENSGIFSEEISKMTETLQAKGMNAEEAQAEAANATPDLINSLKDKFLSKDAADAADAQFDLEALTNLLPGGVGDLLKGAADNPADLLNKAKGLFGK